MCLQPNTLVAENVMSTTGLDLCFAIMIQPTTLYLRCESEDDRDRWISAIRHVSEIIRI